MKVKEEKGRKNVKKGERVRNTKSKEDKRKERAKAGGRARNMKA